MQVMKGSKHEKVVGIERVVGKGAITAIYMM